MSTIQKKLDELKVIFTATEEALASWKSDENLQVPDLIAMLASRLNWSEKDVRDNDPMVRSYIRTHDVWEVIRGAHGGIVKREDRKNKAVAKSVKAFIKAQMKAAIEAKIAEQISGNEEILEVEEDDLENDE
jgi:hypothetical protein